MPTMMNVLYTVGGFFAGIVVTIVGEALGTDLWGRIRRELNLKRSSISLLKDSRYTKFYKVPKDILPGYRKDFDYSGDTLFIVLEFEVLNKMDIPVSSEFVSLEVEEPVCIELKNIFDLGNSISLNHDQDQYGNDRLMFSDKSALFADDIPSETSKSVERFIVFEAENFLSDDASKIKCEFKLGTPYTFGEFHLECELERADKVGMYSPDDDSVMD